MRRTTSPPRCARGRPGEAGSGVNAERITSTQRTASAQQYTCAQAWTALSAAHARIARDLADALARGCGLTVNEFEILLRLHSAAGQCLRLGELNDFVPLTQPALSRAVTRLAGRGLVSRAGAPGDGRGVLIVLAAAGESALRRAVPVHAQAIRAALLDRLAPVEQDQLAQILGRIAAPQT
jgi:DNA-binding MarR family transcriptional regulator